MPSQLDRLEAHASHLLDAFIRLRERYAMLEPMLFHQEVVKVHGSRQKAQGFGILSQSLFLPCAQDIAKLSFDCDKRTPSLHNLVHALTDSNIRAELCDRFSAWRIPFKEQEQDLEIAAALKRIELRKETERRSQFDVLYCQVTEAWPALSTYPALMSYHAIWGKISAYAEVRFVVDNYQFVDIESLEIKWGDMGKIVDTIQDLVEMLGMLIRNTCFAWDMLDEQLAKAASTFWLPSNGTR